jgi:hypothetical protein
MAETLRLESLDAFALMETTFKTAAELHTGLTVALLVACAANLILVCSWL